MQGIFRLLKELGQQLEALTAQTDAALHRGRAQKLLQLGSAAVVRHPAVVGQQHKAPLQHTREVPGEHRRNGRKILPVAAPELQLVFRPVQVQNINPEAVLLRPAPLLQEVLRPPVA